LHLALFALAIRTK